MPTRTYAPRLPDPAIVHSRLSAEHAATLREWAERHRRSVAYYVALAVERLIAAGDPDESRATRR